MSVHRLAKYQTDDPFTRVPNSAVNDERLDLKARGLLLIMLSKPNGWTFRERQLAETAGVGRDQVNTAMRRLIEAGYVRRYREAVDGKPPIIVTEVFDCAQTGDSAPDSAGVGKAGVGKPVFRETRPVSNEGFLVTNDLSNSSAVAKKRGFTEGWEPAPKTVSQIQVKFPNLDLNLEAEKFQDYHRAKGSKFADWDAAFRTWCRNAEKYRMQAAGVREDGFR